MDAYCLLEIYSVLKGQAELQNIPFIDILNEIMANQTTPKKSKRKKGRINSESEQSDHRPYRNKMNVNDFHVLCDTMLAGLGKQLRKCGIDTIILEKGEEPNVKELTGKLPMSVVTRGNKFAKFRKYGHVYVVKSDDIKEQLSEVLEYFNVDVSASDIFSRCMVSLFNFTAII